MNEYPKLSKAPIVEAIFDIRCRLPKESGPGVLKKVAASLQADYPKLGGQMVQTQQFKFQAGKPNCSGSRLILPIGPTGGAKPL